MSIRTCKSLAPAALFALGVAALSAHADAQGTPTCTEQLDLGDLGMDLFCAFGVSGDGSLVVGSSENIAGGLRAWTWTQAGGVVDLGAADAAANGVSADGSTIVGFRGNRACRWTSPGGLQELGTLPGTMRNTATGVSDDGSVIVGLETAGGFPSGFTNAFLWTEAGGMLDIGRLANDVFFNLPCAVSGDGSVVVGTYGFGFGMRQAFRWTAATGVQPLTNASGSGSIARATNVDGSVVVGEIDNRAVRWSGGTVVDLGTLGEGNSSTAFGVSADGSVIVGSSTTAIGQTFAYRWTEATGMVSLGTFGGSVAVLTDVSADGSVVIGCKDSSVMRRSFRMQSSVLGDTFCRPAVSNSAGCGGVVLASGDPRLATGSLELTATLLPRSSFGYFLASQAQGFSPQAGGSQGNLCLDGSVGRFVGPGQIMNSGAEGSFTLAIDLNAMPTPNGPVAVQAGETWNFQAWHRDSVAGSVTSNFTDAVSITFSQ